MMAALIMQITELTPTPLPRLKLGGKWIRGWVGDGRWVMVVAVVVVGSVYGG